MPLTQAALLQQVERIHKKPVNRTCAECGQRDSCWASIIHAPVNGGKEMGVFICGRCYKHHSFLGQKFVVVKSLSTGTPWTEEEVRIFEKSGNDVANIVFEAKLPEADRDELKEIVTSDRLEEAEARLTFITRKYKQLKYYCEKEYKSRLAKMESEEEEENEDDDPSERIRAGRMAMLLGGSLSVRNLTTTKRIDDLDTNSSHSTSTRSLRAERVLKRAASQRSTRLLKSNSDRDLMSRLNNIALGSSPSRRSQSFKKQHDADQTDKDLKIAENEKESREENAAESEKQPKDETSSTTTWETDTSESCGEPGNPQVSKKSFRKSASLDECSSTRNLMNQNCKAASKGLRKCVSSVNEHLSSRTLVAEDTKDDLGGLEKSSSGPALREQSSSRSLMVENRLCSWLGRRETLSCRNVPEQLSSRSLMAQGRQSSFSGLRKSSSDRNLAEHLSSRSLVTDRQQPCRRLRKSSSGRSLLSQGAGRSSSLRNLVQVQDGLHDSRLINDSSERAESPSGIEKSPSERSLVRSNLRKSFAGPALAMAQVPLRKSYSSRTLGRKEVGTQPSCVDEPNSPSLCDMRKSLADKDLNGEEFDNERTAADLKPRNAISMRNLMAEPEATHGGRTIEMSPMRRSKSGRNLTRGNSMGVDSCHAQQTTKTTRVREKSILVRDLDADMLCPSRRDLYDPDAKGLALLMQDSDMGLSFSGALEEASSNPTRPSGSTGGRYSARRCLSPGKAARNAVTVEAISEGNEGAARNEELERRRTSYREIEPEKQLPFPCSSGSNHARDVDRALERKFSFDGSREDDRYNAAREKEMDQLNDIELEDSFRGRDMMSSRGSHDHSTKRAFASSRSERQYELGGSNHSRESNDRSVGSASRRDRGHPRPPSFTCRQVEGHDRRDSHNRRSRHSESSRDRDRSRRHRNESIYQERSSHSVEGNEKFCRAEHARFYSKIDRFLASVGNIHDDDFWVRMIDKWVKSGDD